MRMRNRTVLRWIEEADARRLCELALGERRAAPPEASEALRQRLAAIGAALRSALPARPAKRRDCRC